APTEIRYMGLPHCRPWAICLGQGRRRGAASCRGVRFPARPAARTDKEATMTTLTIWRDDAPSKPETVTSDGAEIAKLLGKHNVTFERWKAEQVLAPGADQDAVLKAYGKEVDRLKTLGGYKTADVVRLAKGTPNTEPMRAKFLSEHTHSEDEVRFFVEGS